MGIADFLFSNTISKRVNEQVAAKAATAFASGISMINFGLNSALPSINPDMADYYEIFKTIGAVYEVTDLISKKVLNCPPIYYRVKNKTLLDRSKTLQKIDPVSSYILKQLAIQEVDAPDLSTLLGHGKANPFQTGTQMLWCTVLSYLLQGNTYIHPITGGGKAKELYCFPNMDILADPNDLLDPIRGYRLLPTLFGQAANTPALSNFEQEEIYHLKTGTPAPVDRRMEYLYGVAPLRAYLESLRSIKEGKTQASKQAKNGGVFGVLSPRDKEDQLSKEQKDQLKEKMVDARRSNDELARVFPSSIGLMWQNIGLPIADLKLLELVSASEEDVYRAYHVPLQYHNQKASTENNVEMSAKQLIYDAVAPVCDAIGETFTIMLGKGYGFDVMEFDYTQLPEMAVNMKEIADYLKALPEGVLTHNEMRAALKYGESTEAYMNEHYAPGTLSTLRLISSGSNPASGSAT